MCRTCWGVQLQQLQVVLQGRKQQGGWQQQQRVH
jgi:hypothetical protein